MISSTPQGYSSPASADFRARATFGVAVAANLLMLPIAIYDLAMGHIALAIGALAVVFVLTANAWMAHRGISYQPLTTYGLVPAGMLFLISMARDDGLMASLWCYPVILACYCMLSERRAWVANAIVLIMGLPMAWLTMETDHALRVSMTLGAVSLFAGILVHVIDAQHRQLHQQLKRDPLTGLLNRLTFNDCMERTTRLHARYRQPVSLLAIDIDLFKKLNDGHGHAAGDFILAEVGALLRRTLRDEDLIFRMGGEEFTVILKAANATAAIDTAERVRHAIESAHFRNQHDQSFGTITVSIGIAELRADEHWETWAKRADDSLYEAKHQGRNRAVLNRQKSLKMSDSRTPSPATRQAGTLSDEEA